MFFTRSRMSYTSAGMLGVTKNALQTRTALQNIYGVTSTQAEKESITHDLIHMKIHAPNDADFSENV